MDDSLHEFDDRLRRAKLTKLDLIREKKRFHDELPHLYGWPWYKWAYDFFNSRNRMSIVCAANQISKSSTQIRKCIHWATATHLWDDLWGRKPNLFWYMYPSKDVATTEFENKWIEEFLPQGKMIDDPVYGWKAKYDKKQIESIRFNSGVEIQFKTYSQDVHRLQASTLYAIFGDEEMPQHVYDEIVFRLAATKGYFNMVFTATLGQEFWWEAIEAIGTDRERFPEAFKRQVSMYDCLRYRDGSASTWTIEEIKLIEARCRSKAEVLRRVYGRFIKDEGRKFHAFDPTKHYVDKQKIPNGWFVYSGVDIGSGGEKGHPSAMVFVAVDKKFRKGLVVEGWRGDGIETTSGDVLEKYRELKDANDFRPVLESYDYAAKDFGTIAHRQGEAFIKANKGHALGEDIVNTLLKHDMLHIFDTPELRKLGSELLKLNLATPKNKAKDDFCDALRYCLVSIPWDFTGISSKALGDEENEKKAKVLTEKQLVEYEIQKRRGTFRDEDDLGEDAWGITGEIDFWNEEYGN